MTRRFLTALALIAMFSPAVCKADPVDFSYSFGISPGPTLPGGTGSVTFSLFSNGSLTAETGAVTPLLAATLFTTSSGTADLPDQFNSPYALTVTVKDTASGNSHDFEFPGILGGKLTSDDSSVTATFTGSLEISQALGSYLYTVSVEPEVANLPAPRSLADALVNANVVITPLQTVGPTDPTDVGPTVSDAPEPATLVLGLLAGPALLLARRRRA